jgi:Holliday junction resolvase
VSAMQRRKGLRLEREIVELHRVLGIHSERVPLSGAQRYQNNGSDVDVYAFGRNVAPLKAEVKGRKDGQGFATLERWLGENDILFLRRNYAEPLVVLPWRIWARLLAAIKAPDAADNG